MLLTSKMQIAIARVVSRNQVFRTTEVIAELKNLYVVDAGIPPVRSFNANLGKLLKRLGYIKLRTVRVRDAFGRRSHSAEWALPNA